MDAHHMNRRVFDVALHQEPCFHIDHPAADREPQVVMELVFRVLFSAFGDLVDSSAALDVLPHKLRERPLSYAEVRSYPVVRERVVDDITSAIPAT
jgi:hypothetical protein